MDKSCLDARRVAFLFNHDAAHQAAHTASIAGRMALAHPEAEIIAATGSPQIASHLRSLLSQDEATALRWHNLDLPGWMSWLTAPVNRVAPVRRITRLHRAIDFFASLDMLVSTERTCLRIKRRLLARDGRAPRFVFVPHGAGDRGVTYHPEMAQFDLMLLSGRKVVDEMAAHGIISPDRCRIIGYAKFDRIALDGRPSLFANDRPVVVYNPHFDPHLSSWYDHGPAILDWFAGPAGQTYNLVFAPHVMLFRKALHISPEYRIARWRPGIERRWRESPNILIDVDSPRLFDMTYMRGADAYLGDVSSQVYEFLARPRPVIFIDTHAGNDRAYDFWSNGPVIRDAGALPALLADLPGLGARYAPVQRDRFAYTIDRSDQRPASVRGAEALAQFLQSLPRR
jgi:hypothetical protein